MGRNRQLWGAETSKAVENFPISGETVPLEVVHWLARLKGAAAAVNGELGLLPKRIAARIQRAATEVAQGKHDDQFPIDVFQTGSGTSTNMNANEVIASLSGEGVHANDHVNMGQSSNDVFPSAVHLAALEVAQRELLPALRLLERSLARKASSFSNVVKAGRTHLMDAVPVTLGQEFGGYSAQMALGSERVSAALVHVGQIPLGGTATGTGLNTHPRFAEKVRARARREMHRRTEGQPRRDLRLRRSDAGRRHRAKRRDRLRQGGRHRQEGERVRSSAARGRARGGGRREAVRPHDRPAADRAREPRLIRPESVSLGRRNRRTRLLAS